MPALSGNILRRFVHGETITVARVAFKAGSEAAQHRHANEQFSFVLSGVMEFTVEGEPIRVKAGEFLHLPSHCLHGARALDEDVVVLDVFSPPRADWGAPGA